MEEDKEEDMEPLQEVELADNEGENDADQDENGRGVAALDEIQDPAQV